MTTKTKRESRSLQLWPDGQSVYVTGDTQSPECRVKFRKGDAYESKWRKPTAAERTLILRNERALIYQERDVMFCDSCLVGDLLKLSNEGRSDLADEFSFEKVTNLRPDPTNWDMERCHEYLSDHGFDLPDPNPWGMEIDDLLEAKPTNYEQYGVDPEVNIDVLRANLIDDMDDETIDGLDKWREAVSDNAEDETIYEWWRVSNWLGAQLIKIGECVLDNDYGKWWGRGCTGQQFIMDGVLQRVAALFD